MTKPYVEEVLEELKDAAMAIFAVVLTLLFWSAMVVACVVLAGFLIGCKGSEQVLGVGPSPLPPQAAPQPPYEPPYELFPLPDPSPHSKLFPVPHNCWFRGGFVCFPDGCVFAPGYQWDTAAAYCADHLEEPACQN